MDKRREQYKIFCLALLYGLRKREIDTLLWRSVDLKNAVIRIERTEYFQPKSEDSVAEVDVAPELVELLRVLKRDVKNNTEHPSPGGVSRPKFLGKVRQGVLRHARTKPTYLRATSLIDSAIGRTFSAFVYKPDRYREQHE